MLNHWWVQFYDHRSLFNWAWSKTFRNSWYFNDSFVLISFKFWVISLIEETFKAFKLHWVLYAIFLLMFIMNKAKISILFFFEQFNSVLNEATFMLWIENDSFWAVIKMSCLSIVEVLVWVIEESEVNRDQLKCFELSEIEKIEIEVFNWFEKTMTSFCIFSNISFLFIQSLLNMTSWWLISAINIDTVNFLWLSMMRLNRILWVIVFLNIFSS